MPMRSRRSFSLLLTSFLLLAACDLFVSAEARVERAEAHVATGDYRAAMIELKNALQEQPDNVDARLLLSRVSLQLGELEAAQKELDRAVEAGATPERVGTLRYDLLVARRQFADALTFLDTDSTIAEADRLYYTTVAELGMQDVPAAREAASQLLARFPDDPRGHTQMAEVLAAEGRPDDALAEVRKALEVAPGNRLALWTEGRLLVTAGRWEEAEAALVAATDQREAPLDAVTQAAALAALTEAHLGQNDVDAATATVAELGRIAPGAPGTRLLNARMALAANKPADAIAELQPVVQALPDYMPAQLLMGAALLAQGSYQQAETNLVRVVARAPDNAEARRLLAQAQLALNRPRAAAESLSPVLDPLGGDPRTDWLMGQAMLRSGSRDEAVELLERSAAAQPDNVRLQTELAGAYIDMGRSEEAIELLESLPQGAADGRRDSLLVLAYAAQGDARRGRADVEALAAAHPDDPRILSLVGSYMLRSGDVAAARRYFTQSTAAAPNDAAPWLALANLEYRTGERDAARIALQGAQAADATNEAAALGLARIALDEGSRAAATEVLDRLIAGNPRAVRARLVLAQLNLQAGNDTRARELFDQVVAATEDRGSALTAVGGAQLRGGRTDDAIATFEKALALRSDDPEALYGLGAAQIAKQDVVAGRRNLEAALKQRPGWIQPAMVLTMLDVQAGRVDEGLARARETRAANPGDVTAIALEADVLAAAGRTDEALTAYADAQAARPTGQVAVRMMQLRDRRGDADAEQPLVQYLDQRPEDLGARRTLAEHFQQKERRADAIREYEKLVAVAPRDAAAMNNLAWLYYEVGDARAETTARRASELAPEAGPITDTLGWILVEKGELDEGVQTLRQAVKQSPDIPEVRFHLAAALARIKQRAEAGAILRELLGTETPFPSRAQAETLLKELGE